MDINEVHQFIRFIEDKEVNGFSSPAEIDMALYRASLDHFAAILPLYATSNKAQDDLAPFKKFYIFTPQTSTAGLVQFPADYLHFLSIHIFSYDNSIEQNVLGEVDQTQDDEMVSRAKSQLRPVAENPFYSWAGIGKIQFYPAKPLTGEVRYLKQPNKSFFDYDRVGRVFTYKPLTSVQLEWDNLNMSKVIFMALGHLGINLSDEQMVQYSELRKSDP